MRISDWSSDVCSSDLGAGWGRPVFERRAPPEGHGRGGRRCRKGERPSSRGACGLLHRPLGELSGDARAGDRGRGGGMTRLLLKDAATCPWSGNPVAEDRSEENTSELQSLMRISYAVFCFKKKKTKQS